MTDLTGSPPSPESPSPPAALELERRSWQTSIAPQYIGLFLWVVFFDQLGRWTLAGGGLLFAVLGALAAGLLCYLLLYYVPAMGGFRSGQPLTTLGTSTFGVKGSAWLTGVLMGLAQVVWFAVATAYAMELTFQGLIACGLLDPAALQPVQLAGLKLPNPMILATILFWSYAAALVGHYLVQIISALMNIYPILMALLLGVSMLMTIKGVPQFQPPGIDPATGRPVSLGAGSLQAFLMIVELIFGFFATAGALAADWGAVSRTERDVQLGGLVGVALASWTVATLALLTVAGVLGHELGSPPLGLGLGLKGSPNPWGDPFHFSFHRAVFRGIGGPLGGTILMVFGLGSLAPTCYAVFLFGTRFADAWPRIPRIHWTLIGTTAACLLIASGSATRLDTIFSLMGATFAPLVAAMAAESLRHRGTWPGPRRRVNAPGLIAWALGLAVGLVPIASQALGWPPGTRFQPAAVFGYLTALAAYLVLAGLGAEAPVLAASAPAPEPEPEAPTPAPAAGP
jgi:cytosine permease